MKWYTKYLTKIGEAYYVHENKQLHLDVDTEGAQYISARQSQPGTPGLAEGVFAKEEQVSLDIVVLIILQSLCIVISHNFYLIQL